MSINSINIHQPPPPSTPREQLEEFKFLKRKLDLLSLQYSQHQIKSNQLVSFRTQLETQYQESLIVKQEFDELNQQPTEEDTREQFEGDEQGYRIYKLIGPVLLPQDHDEAYLNVVKRVEFIEREIESIETKIKEQDKIIRGIKQQLLIQTKTLKEKRMQIEMIITKQ